VAFPAKQSDVVHRQQCLDRNEQVLRNGPGNFLLFLYTPPGGERSRHGGLSGASQPAVQMNTRRRHLLNGPEEFSRVRVDRPKSGKSIRQQAASVNQSATGVVWIALATTWRSK
jgi:hypothetical protein